MQVPSEEQGILIATAERFVEKELEFTARQQFIDANPAQCDLRHWQHYSDMGWTALAIDETAGGFGCYTDLSQLCRTLGQGLALAPLITQAVGAAILRHCKDTGSYLKNLADGSKRCALAFHEAHSSYEFSTPSCTVREGKLTGHKVLVTDAHAVDYYLVNALDNGMLKLCLVNAHTPGLSAQFSRNTDDRTTAALNFKHCDVQVLDSEVANVNGLLKYAQNYLAALTIADAVGAMEALLQITVDYCKQREQFGQRISNFQSLQHKMADMYIALERARSMLAMVEQTCESAIDTSNWDNFALAVAAAKVEVNDSARLIGQHAVQLHGAIGITEELAAAHYFKRLNASLLYGGDSHHHMSQYRKLSA